MKLIIPLWWETLRFDKGYPIMWVTEITDPRIKDISKSYLRTYSSSLPEEELRYFLAVENAEMYHLYAAFTKDDILEKYLPIWEKTYFPLEIYSWEPGVGWPLSFSEPMIEVPSYDFQIVTSFWQKAYYLSLRVFPPPALLTAQGKAKEFCVQRRFIGPFGNNIFDTGLLPGDGRSGCYPDPIVVKDLIVTGGPRLEVGPFYRATRTKSGRIIEKWVEEPDPKKAKLPVFNYRLREIKELKENSSGYCAVTLWVFDPKRGKSSLTDISIEFFPEPEKGDIFIMQLGAVQGERFYVVAGVVFYNSKDWPSYLSTRDRFLWRENTDQVGSVFLIPAYLRKRLVEPNPGLE